MAESITESTRSRSDGSTNANTQDFFASIPIDVLREILRKFSLQDVFTIIMVLNKRFNEAVHDYLEPFKSATELAALHFPDEVKLQKELLKRELTNKELQIIYFRYKKEPFYHCNLDDQGYPALLSPYPPDFISSMMEIVLPTAESFQKIAEFFAWVKADNWLEISKNLNNNTVFEPYELFTAWMDYKGRTLFDWAKQLRCENVLKGLHNFSSGKQNDIAFRIMCGKLQEIGNLNAIELKKFYPLILRFGDIALINKWLEEMKRVNEFPLVVELCVLKKEKIRGKFYWENRTESTLRYLAQFGQLDIFEFIYNSLYKSIDNQSILTETLNYSLYDAARNGYYEIVLFILDLKVGADINFCAGRYALVHIAAICGHFGIVALLVQRGAKYTYSEDGYPLNCAKKFERTITPEFQYLHNILQNLYQVLNEDPIYLGSEKTPQDAALALYSWYANQTWMGFWDISNDQSFARQIIIDIKQKQFKNFEEEFESYLEKFYAKAPKKINFFEGIRDVVLQEIQVSRNVSAQLLQSSPPQSSNEASFWSNSNNNDSDNDKNATTTSSLIV